MARPKRKFNHSPFTVNFDNDTRTLLEQFCGRNKRFSSLSDAIDHACKEFLASQSKEGEGEKNKIHEFLNEDNLLLSITAAQNILALDTIEKPWENERWQGFIEGEGELKATESKKFVNQAVSGLKEYIKTLLLSTKPYT